MRQRQKPPADPARVGRGRPDGGQFTSAPMADPPPSGGMSLSTEPEPLSVSSEEFREFSRRYTKGEITGEEHLNEPMLGALKTAARKEMSSAAESAADTASEHIHRMMECVDTDMARVTDRLNPLDDLNELIGHIEGEYEDRSAGDLTQMARSGMSAASEYRKLAERLTEMADECEAEVGDHTERYDSYRNFIDDIQNDADYRDEMTAPPAKRDKRGTPGDQTETGGVHYSGTHFVGFGTGSPN